MWPVDTTGFSTHVWTRRTLEGSRLVTNIGPFGAALRAWLLAGLLVLFTGGVLAGEPEVVSSGLLRSTQDLRLNVRLNVQATPAVEQALIKGVPMYFVWRADVFRDRWYWADKRENTVSRTLRLAYQPLTRRWRLSVATDPEGGSGSPALTYALHQSFDSLSEALSVVGRVSNWRVADAQHLSDSDLRVQWQFELSLALLPRPFQLGMTNDPDWDIAVRQRINVPAHNTPDEDTAALPGAAKPTEAAK